MLRQGKISEGDYERLREALDSGADLGRGTLPGLSASHGRKFRDIPPVLWVGLVSLGIMVVLKIVFIAAVGPLLLIDAALSAILLLGLYLGHKWAYVLTIVFCLAGVLMTMVNTPNLAVGVLLLNALVLVPVLMSTRYFFPSFHTETGENHS
jgi:hypothetical protein